MVSERKIVETICKLSGFTHEQIFSKSRRISLVQARAACCYLLRTYTDMTLFDIGNYMDRDHSTVCHGIGKVKDGSYGEVVRAYVESAEKVLKLGASSPRYTSVEAIHARAAAMMEQA